jgi:O-antigen/teichoic acid export membrane protein
VKSLAGFVTTFIIARLLGAGVLGTFAMATSITVFLTIPTKAVSGTMNKRISERTDPSAYFTAGMLLIFGFLALISAAILLATPLVNDYLGAPVVGLLVLLVASNATYNVYTSILTGEKKVVSSGVLNTLEQVLRLAFQASLIVAGYSLAGLFVGKILSLVVATLIGIYLSDLSIVRPTAYHFQRLYDYGKYYWISQIKGRSFSWIDVLILGFFVESTLIGIYEVSWTLSSTLILVSQSVQQTLFPEISELGTTDDYDRVRHLVNEGLVFVGVFGIPGFFGALVIGGELLTIYRPVFEQGHIVLLFLITARLLDAYAYQLASVISALDYPEIEFRISTSFIVINTGLNLLFIWQFGWIGAAVATMLSTVVELGLSYHYLSNLIGQVEVPFKPIFTQVVASVVMAGIIYALTWFVPLNNYTAVGLVFVGAGIYVGVLVSISTRIRRKTWMLIPQLDPADVD